MMTQVWHRPPNITPNLGRRKSLIPRSRLPRVILHDNASQQQLLDMRLGILATQRLRAQRLFGLHRKSFLLQQSLKQQQLRNSGIEHVSFLPDAIASAHCKAADVGAHHQHQQQRHESARDLVLHREALPHYAQMNKNKNDNRQSQTQGHPLVKSKSAVQTPTRSFSAFPVMTQSRSAMKKEVTIVIDASARDVLRDERYAGLTRSLVHSDKPLDGFIQLSPSGESVMARYGARAMYSPTSTSTRNSPLPNVAHHYTHQRQTPTNGKRRRQSPATPSPQPLPKLATESRQIHHSKARHDE